jgi:hypothetical protein
MAFTYVDTLPTARDRLRFALGDTNTPGYITDETYTATLLLNDQDEVASVRQLAGHLAVRFANEPGSIRLPSGLSISYRERVAQWVAIATGKMPTIVNPGGIPGSYGYAVVPKRDDGYRI